MSSPPSRILDPALYCPRCAQALVTHGGLLGCDACRQTWPLREQVASFCDLAPAWGGETGDQARDLLQRAEERGWDEAVHDQFPRENIAEYWRMYGPACADWFHLGHVERREVAVCLGVGWGALPMRLAKLFDRVIAVDWVWDRVKFARELLGHEAVGNVTLIHANLGALPLPPESCDLLVLNGGLEWAAFQEEEAEPEAAQRKVLVRARCLLRPGGGLCLGASNRFSAGRLMGRRDHGRPRWAGVVPRPLSRLYRVVGGEPARQALSHSLGGYRRLLAAAGFTEIEGYAAFPSHHYPRMLVPAAGGATLAWAARLSLARRGRRLGLGARLVHSLASSSTFARAGHLLCDSFIIWARRPLAPRPEAGAPSAGEKSTARGASMMSALKARLLAEWQDLGLDGATPASMSVVQFSGNWDRGGKVNWFLFPDHSAQPAVVAKVARTPADAGRMEHEHRALLWLRSLRPEVSQHIPRPLARWEINGHLVTLQQYLSWPPLTKQISALPPNAAVSHALRVMAPFFTELALAGRTEWPRGNPYLGGLIRDAREMANGRNYNASTRVLLEALARLAEEAADLPFAVPHHGDTSTADILVAEGVRATAAARDFHVLDWEWSVRDGMPLIDLASLGLSAAWRHDAQTVVGTIRALAMLPPAAGEVQPDLDDVVNAYCDALAMPRAWRRAMVAAMLLNAMVRMPQSRISHLIISLPDESDEIIVAARALVAGEPGG